MEFGVYHEFPSLAGQPDSKAFQEAFDMVDAADQWGLDVMWLAELHFDPERSVLSAQSSKEPGKNRCSPMSGSTSASRM